MYKIIYKKIHFLILIITLLLNIGCNNNIDKKDAMRQIGDFYEFSLNNRIPNIDCYDPDVFISKYYSGKTPPYYTLVTMIGIPKKNIGYSHIIDKYRKLAELELINYNLQDDFVVDIINAKKVNNSLSECLYLKTSKFRDSKNKTFEAMMFIGTIIKIEDIVTSTSSDGKVAEVIVNFNLDFTSTLMKLLQPD